MGSSEQSVCSKPHISPIGPLKAWLNEPLEDRVMALVEDPSLLELVRDLIEQVEALRREVSEHAAAVQHASDLQDEAEAERDRLKEQFESAQERLARAARLLRYPDGADQFSVDCREWLDDYLASGSHVHDFSIELPSEHQGPLGGFSGHDWRCSVCGALASETR